MQSKIKIPEWEIEFRADRSSGPGGQNVNKTATKITLWFNVRQSKKLSEEQKNILDKKLANWINKDGNIVISEQSSRSQWTNRVNAINKLNEIINDALIPESVRRATKITKAIKEKRAEGKKIHSLKKKSRERIDF